MEVVCDNIYLNKIIVVIGIGKEVIKSFSLTHKQYEHVLVSLYFSSSWSTLVMGSCDFKSRIAKGDLLM